MTHKTPTKESHKELKKSIETILIANDSDLRPFIEIFQHSGENVFQQQLGTLLGVFEIKDNSEDSAYIVNFLASTLKKEYFSNPKRPSPESFEAALHKINLALSEIANQGNVEWMGKIDAVVCALDKTQIHFSAAGNAKILLVREKNISEISEGIDEGEQELNPLKTFTNISSGKLSAHDKFIITTEELFHVFSPTELKKGSLRFPKDKFFQFIKTALVNELAIGGTIIVDIEEAPAAAPEKASRRDKPEALNAFSEKTFQQSGRQRDYFSATEDEDSADKNYTDQKTGHIYVQGEYSADENEGWWSRLHPILSEKWSDFSFWFKTSAGKLSLRIRHALSDLRANSAEQLKKMNEARKRRAILRAQEQERRAEELQRQELAAQKAAARAAAQQSARAVPPAHTSPEPEQIVVATDPEPQEKSSFDPTLLTAAAIKWWQNLKTAGLNSTHWSKALTVLRQKWATRMWPGLEQIKIHWQNLSRQHKIYAALILAAIILVPLGWSKYQASQNQPVIVEEPVKIPTIQEILAGEKNIRFLEALPTALTFADQPKLITVEERIFAVGPQKITLLGEPNTEFAFPAGTDPSRLAAPMPDLALILILTDQNKIISFNAISNKFQDNAIIFPAGAKISALASYLTYMYAVDAENNQIYRYPRAEGGFGPKADWLKETIDLSAVTSMAIDENIYLSSGATILKLFRGQKQDFVAEQSTTPFTFQKIFTTSTAQNIYILDGASGRLATFSKSGELLRQYYAPEIKNARDLVVDEKNQRAYLATDTAVLTLDLQ